MTLTDCLATQAAALDAYLKLLDEEARTLREGGFAQMPALVARKAYLAQRLAQLDRTRQQLQELEGFHPEAGPRGTTQAAGTDRGVMPPQASALHRAWSHLRERAAAAREANQRNSLMVHTLLAFTREALGLMHTGSRPLYGPQGGHAQRPPAGRCLGQG